MTPSDLQSAGHKLYGRKKWKASLSTALGVNVATIHRMMHRPEIPGPYEVAIKGLLDHKRRQDILTKDARRLLRDRERLARKDRPRLKKVKSKSGLIPYAGAEK